VTTAGAILHRSALCCDDGVGFSPAGAGLQL
jgi:hypothetical protein